jgi:general secretion pathway protein J
MKDELRKKDIRKGYHTRGKISLFILHPSSFIPRDASFILEKGFTLLEVLIAVSILSIVLGAVYSTFFLSNRAMEGMDESMTKLQESRRAIDILRRELDALYYKETREGTFLKIVDRDNYGKQATQLDFTAFTTLRPGLSKISYYVEEKDRKQVLFKKIGAAFGKEENEGTDIIDDIEEFTVEAKYNDAWVRTWDTSVSKIRPEEIKISISVMIHGKKVTLSDISRPMYGKAI